MMNVESTQISKFEFIKDKINDIYEKRISNNQVMIPGMLISMFISIVRDPAQIDLVDLIASQSSWDDFEKYDIAKSLLMTVINHQPVMSNDQSSMLTQIAIPVVIQKYGLRSDIVISNQLSNITISEMEKSLFEHLELKEGSSVCLSKFLFRRESLNLHINKVYGLASKFLENGLSESVRPIHVDNVQDFTIAYIYGVVIEPGTFIETKNKFDEKLSNPVLMKDWRDTYSRIIQKNVEMLNIDVNIYVGAPSVLTSSLSSVYAFARESKLWKTICENSLLSRKENTIIQISVHPFTSRILIQFFVDNYCIVVYDYGYPVINSFRSLSEAMSHDHDGNCWHDMNLIADNLIKYGFKNIVWNKKEFRVSNLEDFLGVPLIG